MALSRAAHQPGIEKATALLAREFPNAAEKLAHVLIGSDRRDDAILTVLAQNLSPAAWEARATVRQAFEQILNLRPGPPRDGSFWNDLGFPALEIR